MRDLRSDKAGCEVNSWFINDKPRKPTKVLLYLRHGCLRSVGVRRIRSATPGLSQGSLWGVVIALSMIVRSVVIAQKHRAHRYVITTEGRAISVYTDAKVSVPMTPA